MVKRFSKFGLTIFPSYQNSELNWKEMKKEKIVKTLTELEFIRPLELVGVMNSMELKSQSKKLKTGETKDYYSKIIDFGGQLELTTENGIPHYQMWIEVKPQIGKESLLSFFSEKIYKVKKSKQITVLILTKDISSYKKYCQKERRADLPFPYSHFEMGKNSYEFMKYLENHPEARKTLDDPYTFHKYVRALIVEPRRNRTVYWFIDVVGGAKKSYLTNLLGRDPRENVVFVSLDYDRAFNMNLAEDVMNHIKKTGDQPSAIILDIPRAQESKHLHEIYAGLEEIVNGRAVARFGNKRVKSWIDENTPIIVFANCAPVLSSFSDHRWRIFSVFKSPLGNDFLLQRAKVNIQIVAFKKGTIVTWRTQTETLSLVNTQSEMEFSRKSDRILVFSYMINYLVMRKNRNNNPILETPEPGIIKHWGPERTTTTSKAPEGVLAAINKNDG